MFQLMVLNQKLMVLLIFLKTNKPSRLWLQKPFLTPCQVLFSLDLSVLFYLDLILYAIIYELTDDNLIYPTASHIIWNVFGVLMIIAK